MTRADPAVAYGNKFYQILTTGGIGKNEKNRDFFTDCAMHDHAVTA